MKIGDFTVLDHALELAREDHSDRPEEARRVEKERRAPITTDYPTWSENPARYDFPGIDTPSESPSLLPKDLKHDGRVDVAPEAKGEAPAAPLGSEETAPGERALARAGIPASPEEVFEGRHVRSTGDGVGGPMFNSKEGRPVETDRVDQEQAPPETALTRQSRDISGEQHEASMAIMNVYETYDDLDMSLTQFKRRVQRKKREMSGLADDHAAAMLVVDDVRGSTYR